MVKELLVKTDDISWLSRKVKFCKAVIEHDSNNVWPIEFDKQWGALAIVRCYGDASFTQFVIEKLGLGTVIKQREAD